MLSDVFIYLFILLSEILNGILFYLGRFYVQVVELLIRKLETEPSLHRRVDLFFLVDSITQCSHGHKGTKAGDKSPHSQPPFCCL